MVCYLIYIWFLTWFELKKTLGITKFVGYEENFIETKVLAIIKNGEIINLAEEGSLIEILLESTPFYAESGGQIGDTGTIYNESLEIIVNETQKKLNSLHVHVCKIKKGRIKVGDIIKAKINIQNRNFLRSMTKYTRSNSNI